MGVSDRMRQQFDFRPEEMAELLDTTGIPPQCLAATITACTTVTLDKTARVQQCVAKIRGRLDALGSKTSPVVVLNTPGSNVYTDPPINHPNTATPRTGRWARSVCLRRASYRFVAP